MAELKTKPTTEDVTQFVHNFATSDRRRADAFTLISLLTEWSGYEAVMWGNSIIGFGAYHYRYATGHEGDAPILAFSPRKAALTLYVYSDTAQSKEVLPSLGKYKMSKACIYVNKLSDIQIDILKILCLESMRYIAENNQCACKTR